MPIEISGSSACEGTLRGIFSGSLPIHDSGSYYNIIDGGGFNGQCTGSLLVSNYTSGSATYQHLQAALVKEDNTLVWISLGGSPTAYSHDNTRTISCSLGPPGIGTRINHDGGHEVGFIPNSTIFVDAGQSTADVTYVLQSASVTPAGTRYTIICNGTANASSVFSLSASIAGEVKYMIDCSDGRVNETNQKFVSFKGGKFEQTTQLEMVCDGSGWYITGVTPTETGKIYTVSA